MNVIAVDVGTTSVRLAIISFNGSQNCEAHIQASAKRDISLKQDGVMFEQSTAEIWQAICDCSRECISNSGIAGHSIRSIAFSATCSLVIQDQANMDGRPDVIMWMDHRAIQEAKAVTDSNSEMLRQFGGVCSPEFSLAKLMWLKKNDAGRFNSACGFYELPDWLVQKCTGLEPAACPRSLCCVTCKWGYDAEEQYHCELINSLDADFSKKIGSTILSPGTISGHLSPPIAVELGLAMKDKTESSVKAVVGTSLIDAHSGMLAMLSVPLEPFGFDLNIESTFCSLAGTSSCHMLLSKKRNFARGIWGPYKNVVIQDYYLLEAGQSLTGKLIEMSIKSHEEGKQRLAAGEKLYQIIESLNRQFERESFEGDHLHLLPTFHGNRSPLANPRLKGGVYGLSAEKASSLLDYYVATLDSIAYETRLIMERLGTKLSTILVSGGLMKNSLFMQILADVTQCRVVKMSIADVDFMVMGSGLIARHAALLSSGCASGPLTESSIEGISYRQLEIKTFEPNQKQFGRHEKRYLCYREFVEFSLKVDQILHCDA